MAKGEFVSLLGPSGCGKTTLLRIVAGLLSADRGSVVLDGEPITGLPPHKRDVGVVFQNDALFPHLSVAENVAFGLKAKGKAGAEIGETVARFLAMVRMSDFAQRPVQMLSGGQQQRVAVARALAVGPKLMLFDEPFRVRLLFTETGLVIGAVNVFLPFMILPLYSVINLIDPRLSEAGATLGAPPVYRFLKIVLPLTLPGAVTGVAFVFSLSIAMTTPAFLALSLSKGCEREAAARLPGPFDGAQGEGVCGGRPQVS
jgi:hypothetical protein